MTQAMQEFIQLLNSLKECREEAERKALRQKARKQFGRLMDLYEGLAWQYSPKAQKVRSAENLAALMAPDGDKSEQVQKMEDLYLRRLWRLINAFEKVRQGGLYRAKQKILGSNPECI